MKHVIKIIVVGTISSIIQCGGVEYIKQKPKISEQLADVIETVQPGLESCRPAIRAGGLGSVIKAPKSLSNTTAGGIACILDGWKNIYVTTLTEFKLEFGLLKTALKDFDDVQYLTYTPAPVYNIYRDENGKLKKRTTTSPRLPVILLYLPQERNNALALAKWDITQPDQNFYLIGYLLGYPEVDIEAFYQQPNFVEIYNFKRDKQAALEWLGKNYNEKELESWLGATKKSTDITMGKLEEFSPVKK